MKNEDALEILARLCQSATNDPKSPRGTKGGIGMAEICAALAYAGDNMGADMALAIGTLDHRNRSLIEDHLEAYVMAEAKRDGIKAQWDRVYVAVADAYEDVMAGTRKPGGSRYYRWAASEFHGRALNCAIVAKRVLFRETA